MNGQDSPEMNAAAVGRVVGTEDSTPLSFFVRARPRAVRATRRRRRVRAAAAERRAVTVSGVVSQIRARHEGARFDSDVFLVEDGILPAQTSEVAEVLTTRVEPEIFVPPLPGAAVRRAEDKDRDQALYFDQMEQPAPDRRRSSRRAALRQPRVPRRHPRRARQHLAASRASRRRRPTPRSCSSHCSTRACSAPRRSTPRR